MNFLSFFFYKDTDSLKQEISDIYSYSEESEFFGNRNAFEECMEDIGLPLTWKHMVPEQQGRALNYLMTTLEVSCHATRIKSARAIGYLIQGNFGECLSLEEQATNSQANVFLLYEQGIFQAFVQQLHIEADISSMETQNQQQASISTSQIFNDSSELRLILSVLCTITETMYHAKDSNDLKIQELRQQFISDLQNPFGDELLVVTLFQMLNNFCGGLAPHYPVRKITLLLWKVILITLGGTKTLRELKESNRKLANLEPISDDTIEVTKNMRPCTPPVMPDGRAREIDRRPLSGGYLASKRKVFKQPAFDDVVFAYAKECFSSSLAELENHPDFENENPDEIGGFELNDSTENAVQSNSDPENNIYPFDSDPQADEKPASANSATTSDSGITEETVSNVSEEVTELNEQQQKEMQLIKDFLDQDEDVDLDLVNTVEDFEDQAATSSNLKPNTRDQLPLDGSRSDVTTVYKGLPWTPKVRKADLNQHLSNIRLKFLGYTLPNDFVTTFGLPDPIIEGIDVLKRHLYVSLSEVQLDREEAIEKYPLTHKEINPCYREAPAEKLYSALLPKLPQYMIALLKILLAASTSSKNKTERSESINIMGEMNSDNGSLSIIQTMKMNTDANRHKEVIIKSVSAILILLLKHFKVNHIYQFEYVSQQLMFANCIPLILKFLSQDIYSYIHSKSSISAIDFPACVIGEQPELTYDTIELCSFQPYCWRNMFSCINLVRILNKLTKWKHSRIMMLVVFKSAPTLTKALSVRHAMFQLYVLKLLKVQLKFLGRQWKKTNMTCLSAIYQKVRHRLTDDWAYSNDNEARPWEFQAEEFTLQANITKFHQRRYYQSIARSSMVFDQSEKLDGTEAPADDDYDFGMSDISQISPHFERNYERWLESEVFFRKIDWDRLLND